MISLYKPYMPQSLSEIDNILHSSALSYGKWGHEFENVISKFIGCDERTLVVNSFSSAIQLVIYTLGLHSEDEVIASPQCCLASTQPLVSLGLKVVWADIDPKRGTLDPDDVRKHITSKTRLIWHNHHCGYPGYIDEINDIARQYNLYVVDDCIEAFGAEYKGHKMGNVGTDITVFSFQTVRLPNTIDGGGVIFRDSNLYKKAVRVRDLGVDRSTFRDEFGEISPLSDVDIFGFGMTCNEVSAYIGYSQMLEVENLLKQQRKNGHFWSKKLCSLPISAVEIDVIDIEPNYWVYGILCPDKMEAIKFFRNMGFYASGVHIPNSFYSIFGEKKYLKGVSEFYKHFVALPSGWWLSDE
ncbi:DegT/DnrJ/EryC1/StrS family aminotransferase [Mediterranea massiliensis]|uniref:DegT/DnrJ/EryC1/StrS family aminotransferase n=1 Tax=Mediterranea massiliensis TaxID=1841865 RepID=UPI0025A4760D|nr:aminotransferase class V-fold PLP-dependent enzyme [Mediterranea massiliensis]MDM8338445.1 aminotransferase class V-fold PLP-dependent enzyme [Mediterranea massiliensis]